MVKKNIIEKYIKEKNIIIDNKSDGLEVNYISNELNIKGSQSDLLELADYILSLALSDNNEDHIHLDDLTLISDDSDIKEIIIEKK